MTAARSWEVDEGDDYLHEFNQDDGGSEMDYFKINLRLKDIDRFNLNDGFIEAFKSLPTKATYAERRSELEKIIRDEIDLVNNVNILSIFAMSGSQ